MWAYLARGITDVHRMNTLCGAVRDAYTLTLRCQRQSVGIGTGAADPIRAVSSATHHLLPLSCLSISCGIQIARIVTRRLWRWQIVVSQPFIRSLNLSSITRCFPFLKSKRYCDESELYGKGTSRKFASHRFKKEPTLLKLMGLYANDLEAVNTTGHLSRRDAPTGHL